MARGGAKLRFLGNMFLTGIFVLTGCGGDDGGGTTAPGDTTPPSAVTSLTANALSSSDVRLVWTAPGDDGTTGRATQYDIRHSTTPLTEGGWGSALPEANPPTPKVAGSGEVFTVTGLQPGTPYYFGLKAADEVPNWTGVSNVATATTPFEETPALVVTPSPLDFGSDQTQMTFTITNGGTGTLSWTVTDNETWLSVSPASGTTTTELDVVTVTVNRAGLNPDDYTGVVTVTPSAGGAQQVGVTMTVADQIPDGFVLIQPGTFTMGSPSDEPGRYSDETQHQVTLTKAFYLSDHEVTQAEWEAIMWWNDSYFSGDSRPVETVTWYDCIDFCNNKSQSEGLTPAYTLTNASYSGDHITSATVTWNQNANGYRLPTEAEWEYACRATSTTAFCNGAITHTGCSPVDPNLTQVGWYCGNANSQTHDVMGKSPNAWNLFDMHGNVYEWCWDRYGSYSGLKTDPTGAASDSYRVLRGGSWRYRAQQCRSACRYSTYPSDRFDFIGLRLSRTAP